MTFLRKLARTALTVSTGFGLRDFLRKHKRGAWAVIALVVLNEIRGLAVVYGVLRVVFA